MDLVAKAKTLYGIPGETYRLRIEGVDVDNDGTPETYTGESVMPGIAVADSIDVVYTEFNSFFKAWEVLVYAQDPPDEENYYLFKVMKNDTLLTDTLDEWVLRDDEMLNGAYIPGMTAQFIEHANDSLQVRENDTVTLVTQCVTKEYNSYYWELNAESSYSSPLFSGPPANVSTNLEGSAGHGPVGFFETHAVSRISKVIKNPDLRLADIRP